MNLYKHDRVINAITALTEEDVNIKSQSGCFHYEIEIGNLYIKDVVDLRGALLDYLGKIVRREKDFK